MVPCMPLPALIYDSPWWCGTCWCHMHSRVNRNDGEHGGSDSTSSKPSNVVSNGRADEQLEQLVATGMTPAAAARAEGADRVTGDGGHPVLTREEVVQEFFGYMFPDTFQLALPVLRHKVWPAEHAFHAPHISAHSAFASPPYICHSTLICVTCCMPARFVLSTSGCSTGLLPHHLCALHSAGGGPPADQVGRGGKGAGDRRGSLRGLGAHHPPHSAHRRLLLLWTHQGADYISDLLASVTGGPENRLRAPISCPLRPAAVD